MSIKTRYLQLSDTVIMEYCMLENAEDETYSNGEEASNKVESTQFIYTELADGHYAIFSPALCEVELNNDTQIEGDYKKRNRDDIETLNNINHIAVPQDSTDSYWFTFLDSDYEYCRKTNVGASDASLSVEDLKIRNNEDNTTRGYTVPSGGYGKYCKSPFNPAVPFHFIELEDIGQHPKWDVIKLYFISGYDFSDIFGALLRLSVPTNDGKFLDLCNFFYTRSNVYKYIKYITKPIIFGNYIFDKYIEITVPSIAGIETRGVLKKENGEEEDTYLRDILNINSTANIRLMFSYIDEENKELAEVEYKIDELFSDSNPPLNKNVLCQFARTHTIKGSIPTQRIQSDNLGVYVAMNPDYPYIEFYGTWKDQPLSIPIVQQFNTTIPLYDNSLVKRDPAYVVPQDYEPEYNMKKWVVMHEIECLLVNTEQEIIKEETYNLSQLFVTSTSEITKFYYRPVFFDENEKYNVNDMSIIIHYSMRLMNIEDSVQFVKTGSLTLSNENSDISRFWGKGAKLPFADTLSYKVYNKIVEPRNMITGSINPSGGLTKYVKVFYNVSNITLSVQQGEVASGNYTLIISRAPRNYKFIFKQQDINGNNKYVDLTDSYYKLYAKDANGNDIIIDPTYSSNMNLMLGELEFNINPTTISKLYNVPQSDRYISIVAYNNDNSVSSLYDMRYTF